MFRGLVLAASVVSLLDTCKRRLSLRMASNKLICLLLLSAAVLVLASARRDVVKGRANELFFRRDHSTEWRVGARAHSDASVRLVFAIRQRMDLVHALLRQVSDPKSTAYGKYLSHEEVGRLVSDVDAHDRVYHFLRAAGVRDITSTHNKDFITARMTVAQAEKILSAEYTVLHACALRPPHSAHGVLLSACRDCTRWSMWSATPCIPRIFPRVFSSIACRSH